MPFRIVNIKITFADMIWFENEMKFLRPLLRNLKKIPVSGLKIPLEIIKN